MHKFLGFFVLVGSVVLTGLGAQTQPANSTDTRGGSLSIEELYLSQDVEIQLLRAQALSSTRESKFLALQNIQFMVEDKRVGPDSRDVLLLLDSLAGEGVYRVVRNSGEVNNYFPDVRREAVSLLGKIGGKEALEILTKVAKEDKETMVLSEAVYALALIASDKDKHVLPYITYVIVRNNARQKPDDNLAFACLLAIEKLGKTFNGLNDPDILGALLDITSGVYIRDVRLKAIDVISKLRGYRR